MPRDGSGVYSYPPNGNAVTATPIDSSKYNARAADVLSDMNSARPIPAGGTGGNTAVSANDNLNTISSSIASAATTDLSTATGINVTVTGSATIGSFGAIPAGALRVVTFSGAPTLTNSASLILPGGANIVAAAGDVMSLRGSGSSNNVCVGYQRANGQPVSTTFPQITDSGALELAGIISPAALAAGSTNDYTPTGFSTSAVLRLTGNAAGSTLTGLLARNSGTFLYITNIGAANITLLGNNAGSLAANRFLLSSPIVLPPGQSVNLWYDITSTGWRCEEVITAAPPAGSRKNLKVVTTSATAATITADELVLEDAFGNTYRAPGGVNVSYATGTAGAGGIDTGTIAASNWYYEYVIYNPTTNVQTAVISLSSTAPTMPAGYTFKARAGESYYDAGSKLRFKIQVDRRIQFVIGTNPTGLPVMASGSSGSPTTPTWSPIAVGTFVPPTATTIRGVMANAQSDSTRAILAPNNSYGAWNSSTNPPPVGNGNNGITGSFIIVNEQFDFVLESTNIYYASSNGSTVVLANGYDTNL